MGGDSHGQQTPLVTHGSSAWQQHGCSNVSGPDVTCCPQGSTTGPTKPDWAEPAALNIEPRVRTCTGPSCLLLPAAQLQCPPCHQAELTPGPAWASLIPHTVLPGTAQQQPLRPNQGVALAVCLPAALGTMLAACWAAVVAVTSADPGRDCHRASAGGQAACRAAPVRGGAAAAEEAAAVEAVHPDTCPGAGMAAAGLPCPGCPGVLQGGADRWAQACLDAALHSL